jgi:hypothetical protein
MNISINFKAISAAIVCTTLAVMTGNGSIDNYISFAGELNAAAFCLITGMGAILSTAASFEINH